MDPAAAGTDPAAVGLHPSTNGTQGTGLRRRAPGDHVACLHLSRGGASPESLVAAAAMPPPPRPPCPQLRTKAPTAGKMKVTAPRAKTATTPRTTAATTSATPKTKPPGRQGLPKAPVPVPSMSTSKLPTLSCNLAPTSRPTRPRPPWTHGERPQPVRLNASKIKKTPEPRSRPANNSTSRGVRGAVRGGWNISVHPSSVDNVASRSSASGTGMASTNSSQKQSVASFSTEAAGMDRHNPNTCVIPGLPDDLFLEILSRVVPLDLPWSKCVKKAWRRLIDDLLHRKELPQTLRGFFIMDEVIWGKGGGFNIGLRCFVDLLPSAPLNIDPTFNFLLKLPWIDFLSVESTCNGHLLFEIEDGEPGFDSVPHYIVCNPATKQWEDVPTSGLPPLDVGSRSTYLVFDPAVSTNFHLIHFIVPEEEEEFLNMLSVYTYSSETGRWSRQDTKEEQLEGRHFDYLMKPQFGGFLNSMLHVIIDDVFQSWICAIDVKGNIHKTIPLLETKKTTNQEYFRYNHGGVANSQDYLHLFEDGDVQLSIWVLEDYKAQKWVLKDTVTYLDLFGEESCEGFEFRVVAVHPDCSIVFFQHKKRLISSDMDRKAVRVVRAFENIDMQMPILPYVPYLSKSPALTTKHCTHDI